MLVFLAHASPPLLMQLASGDDAEIEWSLVSDIKMPPEWPEQSVLEYMLTITSCHCTNGLISLSFFAL
jgi:hypothetical protein